MEVSREATAAEDNSSEKRDAFLDIPTVSNVQANCDSNSDDSLSKPQSAGKGSGAGTQGTSGKDPEEKVCSLSVPDSVPCSGSLAIGLGKGSSPSKGEGKTISVSAVGEKDPSIVTKSTVTVTSASSADPNQKCISASPSKSHSEVAATEDFFHGPEIHDLHVFKLGLQTHAGSDKSAVLTHNHEGGDDDKAPPPKMPVASDGRTPSPSSVEPPAAGDGGGREQVDGDPSDDTKQESLPKRLEIPTELDQKTSADVSDRPSSSSLPFSTDQPVGVTSETALGPPPSPPRSAPDAAAKHVEPAANEHQSPPPAGSEQTVDVDQDPSRKETDVSFDDSRQAESSPNDAAKLGDELQVHAAVVDEHGEKCGQSSIKTTKDDALPATESTCISEDPPDQHIHEDSLESKASEMQTSDASAHFDRHPGSGLDAIANDAKSAANEDQSPPDAGSRQADELDQNSSKSETEISPTKVRNTESTPKDAAKPDDEPQVHGAAGGDNDEECGRRSGNTAEDEALPAAGSAWSSEDTPGQPLLGNSGESKVSADHHSDVDAASICDRKSSPPPTVQAANGKYLIDGSPIVLRNVSVKVEKLNLSEHPIPSTSGCTGKKERRDRKSVCDRNPRRNSGRSSPRSDSEEHEQKKRSKANKKKQRLKDIEERLHNHDKTERSGSEESFVGFPKSLAFGKPGSDTYQIPKKVQDKVDKVHHALPIEECNPDWLHHLDEVLDEVVKGDIIHAHAFEGHELESPRSPIASQREDRRGRNDSSEQEHHAKRSCVSFGMLPRLCLKRLTHAEIRSYQRQARKPSTHALPSVTKDKPHPSTERERSLTSQDRHCGPTKEVRDNPSKSERVKRSVSREANAPTTELSKVKSGVVECEDSPKVTLPSPIKSPQSTEILESLSRRKKIESLDAEAVAKELDFLECTDSSVSKKSDMKTAWGNAEKDFAVLASDNEDTNFDASELIDVLDGSVDSSPRRESGPPSPCVTPPHTSEGSAAMLGAGSPDPTLSDTPDLTVPDAADPTVTDSKDLAVPDTQDSTVPGASNPKSTLPGAPGPIVPGTPDPAVPDAPDSAPGAPGPTVPDAPDSTVPDLPAPTVPDAPVPTVPDAAAPTVADAPVTSVSNAPASTMPDAPKNTICDEVSLTLPTSPNVTTTQDSAHTFVADCDPSLSHSSPSPQKSDDPTSSEHANMTSTSESKEDSIATKIEEQGAPKKTYSIFVVHEDALPSIASSLTEEIAPLLAEGAHSETVEKIPESSVFGQSSESLSSEKASENLSSEKPSESASSEKPSESLPSEKPCEGLPSEKPSENVRASSSTGHVPVKDSHHDTVKQEKQVVKRTYGCYKESKADKKIRRKFRVRRCVVRLRDVKLSKSHRRLYKKAKRYLKTVEIAHMTKQATPNSGVSGGGVPQTASHHHGASSKQERSDSASGSTVKHASSEKKSIQTSDNRSDNASGATATAKKTSKDQRYAFISPIFNMNIGLNWKVSDAAVSILLR